MKWSVNLSVKKLLKKIEDLMELGGTKKEIILLCISGAALVLSLIDILSLPFDIAWVPIVLCGVPIVMEAVIGLLTAFDIKADVRADCGGMHMRRYA